MVFGLKDMTQRFVDVLPLTPDPSPEGEGRDAGRKSARLVSCPKGKTHPRIGFFWCLPNCQRSKEKNRRETRRSKASFVEAILSIGRESAERQRGVRFFFLKCRRALPRGEVV